MSIRRIGVYTSVELIERAGKRSAMRTLARGTSLQLNGNVRRCPAQVRLARGQKARLARLARLAREKPQRAEYSNQVPVKLGSADRHDRKRSLGITISR